MKMDQKTKKDQKIKIYEDVTAQIQSAIDDINSLRYSNSISKLKKILDIHSLENGQRCKFRPIPATDSDSFRPLIPVDSGHLFRFIPDTFLVKPESLMNEAALDNLKRKGHHFPSENERRRRWPKRGYPCEKSERF